MHTKRSMAWKIKGVSVLVSCLLIYPSIVFSGKQENIALSTYFDALSHGDLSQVNSLLSSDFGYYYYKNGKLKKLSRNEELKSLEKLVNDTRNLNTKGFDKPDSIEQDKRKANIFHVKFSIFFEDSPKVYTDSFFRGAVLNIDETLIVTVKENKITRIEEVNDKKNTNKLSFGFLKCIYIGNTEVKGIEIKDGWVYELLDRNSHKLLLMKKVLDVRNEYITETYYWPDKNKIENFE